MSQVYFSLESTFGLPLIAAESVCNSNWTTPRQLANFIQFCTSLDFADYDSRRLALAQISKLKIPKFFDTYSFDPTAYPLFPPRQQTRFPAFGTYVLYNALDWSEALQNLSAALAYRDSDGSIDTPKENFLTALATLDSLYNIRSSFYDRFTYEVFSVLVWSIYPPL